MEKLRKLLGSPLKIYGWSMAVFLIVFFVGIPASNFGNKGQMPFGEVLLVFAAYTVILFAISIITTVIYWQWFKKYWYFNLAIAGGSAYFIDIYLLAGVFSTQ